MSRQPQIAPLPDRRLHLQDGPIDLIIGADGPETEIRAAYRAAVERFTGLLDELCSELPDLRKAADRERCSLTGIVARRMHMVVAPFAAEMFITPMAAVAGAVAEEILGAMLSAAKLTRAYVNNGGDIALHLRDAATFSVGLMDRPDDAGTMRRMTLRANDGIRGVATSGRRGRSFSLGIADAVTVLARSAAQADAAATVIGNAVDLPGHSAVVRRPAYELQPDSDLGHRLVTCEVGDLCDADVATALASGEQAAQTLLADGLIEGAVLQLAGNIRIVGARPVEVIRPSQLRAAAA
ncbi:conserved hypothetical protein [Bradyrhizobium sp. ORS 375]|uniref:UPF0280 family protein n=1 Tax=Bradyrhizobium sp. (strain ORS 375) TaxID=566679 RepID=UPI00024095C5|nr:UPF0280 family protein [Bradyrhizobium sp. ORS 375]CCD90436.1 conserved hypothetical protein [Bradyrhizobium sp. ORS 375]